MGEIIFDALSCIFGSSFADYATSFIEILLNAMENIITESQTAAIINIFLGIGCSLMTVFLFMNILEKTTQDMITLEKLVLMFIKWFLGCAILIYLPDILYGLFHLMKLVFDVTKSGLGNVDGFTTIPFFPDDGNPDPTKWPESYDVVKAAFEAADYEDTLAFVHYFPSVLVATCIKLFNFIANIATFLFAIGNALSLIARTVFAPIAVAQCFDEGQRNNGIHFLKKFAADGLTFAIIFAIFWGCTKIQAELIPQLIDVDKIAVENISKILVGKHMFALIAVQFAAIGGVMKANQIANDVLHTS